MMFLPGVSVQEGLCLGVSLWRVSVQGGICPGGLCLGVFVQMVSIRMVSVGRLPESEKWAVRILLEYFLLYVVLKW